jgi:diaminopimelate decarboxylase
MSAPSKDKNFDEIAPKLAHLFENVFPGKDNKKVKIIAEPGRFFCQ